MTETEEGVLWLLDSLRQVLNHYMWTKTKMVLLVVNTKHLTKPNIL